MGSIHPTAIMDASFRCYQGGKEASDIVYRQGKLGNNLDIGAGVVIGRGAVIEDSVVIDHHCIVEPNATIRSHSLLIYRAIVGCEAYIGNDCIIGGFIAERCNIGPNCRIFGQLVHRQSDTTQSWDEHAEPEASAIVGEFSFIGFGSIIVGGVTVGPRAYVCAGATISRDVPPRHVAFGVNNIIPVTEWRGKLSQNPTMME